MFSIVLTCVNKEWVYRVWNDGVVVAQFNKKEDAEQFVMYETLMLEMM